MAIFAEGAAKLDDSGLSGVGCDVAAAEFEGVGDWPAVIVACTDEDDGPVALPALRA